MKNEDPGEMRGSVLGCGEQEAVHRGPDNTLQSEARPPCQCSPAKQDRGRAISMRTVSSFMVQQWLWAGECGVAARKELTLELRALSSSFYSPGGHRDPSPQLTKRSQDEPGTGPGNHSKKHPEPSHPGSVHRNQGD